MSHIGLAFVLMLRPFIMFIPELVMSMDFLSFEHPSVFYFDLLHVYQGYDSITQRGSLLYDLLQNKSKCSDLPINGKNHYNIHKIPCLNI